MERNAQARLTLPEQVAVALVGLFGGAEAGVLTHGPEAAAVRSGLDTAGERKLSREVQLGHVVEVVTEIIRSVEPRHFHPRDGSELLLPLRELGERFRHRPAFPLVFRFLQGLELGLVKHGLSSLKVLARIPNPSILCGPKGTRQPPQSL